MKRLGTSSRCTGNDHGSRISDSDSEIQIDGEGEGDFKDHGDMGLETLMFEMD